MQHRCTRRLVVYPRAVVDLAASNGDIFTFGSFDLNFKKGCWIGKSFPVRKASHAIGSQRAARDGVDQCSVYFIKIVFALVAFVPIGRRRSPQHVGLVYVGPVHSAGF